MDIIYKDKDIIVCIKPSGILSTDEPGGLPDLIRAEAKNIPGSIRTVHRLDRVVSGLMVLAIRSKAASDLSRQIRCGEFKKQYLAVVHGSLQPSSGEFRDFLYRNKNKKKTYIVDQLGKEAQEAILDYQVIAEKNNVSKILINLKTGRTHQIRAQFSGRGFPLVGDRKYGTLEDSCNIGLWSYALDFFHPYSCR